MENKLKSCLESGKSVIGLEGYVELGCASLRRYDDESTVIVQVKCVGLETDCNGVKVKATPISGIGEFEISPCKWYDTPEQLQERKAYLERCEAAEERLRDMFRPSYLTRRKAQFLEYVEGMGIDAQRGLREEMIDKRYATESTSYRNLVKKCSEPEVKRYAKEIICQDLKVEPDDVRWRV